MCGETDSTGQDMLIKSRQQARDDAMTKTPSRNPHIFIPTSPTTDWSHYLHATVLVDCDIKWLSYYIQRQLCL